MSHWYRNDEQSSDCIGLYECEYDFHIWDKICDFEENRIEKIKIWINVNKLLIKKIKKNLKKISEIDFDVKFPIYLKKLLSPVNINQCDFSPYDCIFQELFLIPENPEAYIGNPKSAQIKLWDGYLSKFLTNLRGCNVGIVNSMKILIFGNNEDIFDVENIHIPNTIQDVNVVSKTASHIKKRKIHRDYDSCSSLDTEFVLKNAQKKVRCLYNDGEDPDIDSLDFQENLYC